MHLEEAARCPSCNRVEALIISQRAQSPSTGEIMDVAVYECPEVLCIRKGERRIIQSNLIGEVMKREVGERGHDKEFPHVSPTNRSLSRAQAENLLGHEID